FLLVTDVGNAVDNGVIYRIDSPGLGFEPGVAYSASDTLGLVGTLNLDNGFVTPIVTGFDSAPGLLFIAPDGDNDGDDKSLQTAPRPAAIRAAGDAASASA